MYNKNTYRKTNDKKILHKIGKRWVTVSIAMLALLGGGMLTSSTMHVSANSQAQTVAVKSSTNQQLRQHPQSNSGSVQNSQASASTTNDIMHQAKAMHRNIVGNAPTNVSNSSAESSSANSASGESVSSSASKPKGLMLDTSAPSKPRSTNSNVVNSGSSKVSQPSSVSASSNSASGKGMTTLDLGTPSQQARGWNFVQHGIKNNDYASVNNSGSSSVNNSASGNQTASESSSSAKSNTASAPIHQTDQNSLNSLNAKLKAMESSTNTSSNASATSANAVNTDSNSNKNENKKALLKDNAQPDYFSGKVTKTSNDLGLNYKVYANGGVEFTDGTANSNLSNFTNSDYGWNEVAIPVAHAKAIKFDSGINTKNVTNMSNMFYNNNSLQSLTLPNSFDTSNVTNMNNMFKGDNSLKSLTLPNSFNTSKVTDMGNMFNMRGLFGSDSSLQSLTLPSSFDTSSATNMNGMFAGDNSLQSLTLPNSFDTSKVTDMGNMFTNDNSLQSLTLPSSFDTHNVTSMSNMFESDSLLQSLTLPISFDTRNVTDMGGMFADDTSLQSLTLPSSFNTHNVTTMDAMFNATPNLSTQSIQNAVNKMNTSKVTDMSYMFTNDSSLQSLTLPSSFDTHNVTSMSSMFESDTSLQSLTLPSSFDTRNVTNMPMMFGQLISNDGTTSPLSKLTRITVQSPNTKFNSLSNVPKLYKQLPIKDSSGKYYTLPQSNDFSRGNLGTFIPNNPIPSSDYADINYQYKGHNIGNSDIILKHDFNNQNTISAKQLKNIPTNYHVANPNQVITFNGKSQDVAVQPIPSEWDTISYEYQPNSNQSNYYEVINQGQAYGRQGTNYTIQSSDVPVGYQLVDPNNSFIFGSSDGFHRIMIKPIDDNNTDIPAVPNTVNIKGTVDLHFIDGNKTKDIKLDYLTQDSDAKQINVLDDVDYNNGANTKPTDFLGKMIQGFDTTNFTYNGSSNVGYYTPNQSDTDYDHGSTKLLDHNVNLYFTAKQGTNPVQNGSNDTIEYTDNGKVIGSKTVNSSTGSKIDPSNYVPKGYHVASDNNGQKSFTNDGSTHNVEVEGNTISDTTIKVNQPNGTPVSIPVNNHKIGDKITINPNQYAPSDYSANSSDTPITVTIAPSNNNNPNGYQLQPSGNDTTPNAKNNVYDPNGNTISYNYHYDPDHANNTITVQYKNQNGKIVGTKSYNVAPGNKVDPSTNLPDGYNQGNGNQATTASTNPQTITYNVKGKPASQLGSDTNKGMVNLHIVEESNGNQVNSYNVQVNEGSKLVGSDFTIDPTQSTDTNNNKLVPKGYIADSTDKAITGVITNNGATTDSGTDTLIYDAQGKNGYNIHYQNPSDPNNNKKDIVVPTNNDKAGQHLTNADVPNGYHLPSDTNFSFNSDGNIIDDKTGQQLPNNRVPLEGNDIQGKANIVLKYQILDPTGKNVVKTIYNNADDAQVILNGQVGGSQTINPWRYWKKDFTIPSGAANQSDTIHFTPSDDNANDENGQQFNPTLTYTATAQQAGDVVVKYVDTDSPIKDSKGKIIGYQPIKLSNGKSDTQDLGNFNDLVGQTVRLGQKEPSDNDANINNDSNVQYVLEVPQGYHLEYNSNPITLSVGQVASNNSKVHYPKSGLGMLYNASRFYRRPVGMFLTVGLSRPVTPNKPKSSASASSSSSASVKPSSATSVTPSSASSASSSANSSTSVTSSGNTYISNTSYISYVTNNYSSSANTNTSYASASTATPIITPVVNPVVTPTVNSATESTTSTNVESTSAKPTEVVNNDNDNNTTYNISGSEADKLSQRIPVGSKVYHNKVTVKRLSQKKLGMYYIMVTKPTWIYRGTRFTRRNRIRVIKPKNIIAVPIQRIFRINGRMVFQIRIRVNRHHNSAFITGNTKYVQNAYIQPKELRGHRYVRVLRDAELYRSPRYNSRTRVGNIYRGAKLRVKRIRYIASKHMTRIQLTNGYWFTANKNFVKLVK